MTNCYFDTDAFLAALDEVMEKRGISKYKFFQETGIQRMNLKGRKGMSVHTLATITFWSGLNPQDFMKRYDEVLV